MRAEMRTLSKDQKELLKQAVDFQQSRQGKGDDQMWFFYTGVLLGIIGYLSPEDDLLPEKPKYKESSPDHN